MSSPKRKLAAIMFTDIVGYTELMGRDEEKGFSILVKNTSLQKPIIQKYNGTCLKEMGDGLLAWFDTATDAVLCGKEIQDSSLDEPDLNLRIGIHLGEVVFKENDVFGDGVNIASRLQEKAPPGTIYFSEAVFRNIQNKRALKASFVKEEELKNVQFPVRIYKLDQGKEKEKNTPQIDFGKSIAVLPFVNMSGDPEQEYFCDGISDEIINAIVQYPDIKVAARTSSFSFKGKNDDLRNIGKKLGVSNVLEGSVRKSGKRIRVTVQLLEALKGFHLWSKKYDRELDDVFAIQDEIAQDIADQLMSTLTEKEKAFRTRDHTQNLEAYQLYFKGRSLYFQRGSKMTEGMECFRKAIEIDPDYALAYSGLADSYVMLCLWGYISPEECWSNAIPASRKATQIDPDLSETCHTRGIIALLYENDYQLAEMQFKKAIKLNPSNTQPRIWFGLFYCLYFQDNLEEGLKQCEIATINDPLSGYAHNCYALALIYVNRIDEAEKESIQGLKLDPESLFSHSLRSQVLAIKGNFKEALVEARICLKLAPNGTQFMTYLINIYLKTGKLELAHKMYAQLEKTLKKDNIQPSYAAIGASLLGENERAMQLFKTAVETRDTNIAISLSVLKQEETVTKLPGIKELLHSAGIPIKKDWVKYD